MKINLLFAELEIKKVEIKGEVFYTFDGCINIAATLFTLLTILIYFQFKTGFN